KMPVTILLKAIGLTPEQILAHFFSFDSFRLMSEGAQLELVPERLRGEMARFDIADREGRLIVAKDKRITAKHIREMEVAGMKHVSVPEDYLLGRALAHNVVAPRRGELLGEGNGAPPEGPPKEPGPAYVGGTP